MNKAEVFWDEKAINFDEEAKKHKDIAIKIVDRTTKYLISTDRVLDLGCATGAITDEISNKVTNILGIDISSKLIEKAKRNIKKGKRKHITFENTTIFDNRFEKETFTVVLAFNVLHLLEDPLNVVEQINKMLQPGGLFISATRCINKNSTSSKILVKAQSETRKVPYLKLSTFTVLESLMSNSGFQIIETENLKGTPTCYFIVAKKR